MRHLPIHAACAGLVLLVWVHPGIAESPAEDADAVTIEVVDPLSDARAAFAHRHAITATNQIGQRLLAEMITALRSKPPEQAAALAHLRTTPADSPPLANMPEVTAFRLTSLRLLNAANSPDRAEAQVLEDVARSIRLGTRPPEVIVQRITWPDGSEEWRGYRPLAALSNCLTCHGLSARAPATLRTALLRHAPAESALDYKAGEWRGLLRVTIAVPPTT